MKSKKLLDDFITYCESHPELRFWQCLSSWCNSIVLLYDGEIDNLKDKNLRDTFFF
jgi:hypothetical protein